MGVPAFFRWLSLKYEEIVADAVEERRPVDCTRKNPNFQEFDNLYLDMNGIIHPCTHPDDRPAPKTEDEMFVLIFEYIDRVFNIVRPRKLLYMAIDGVAPRAKMNQQRSRRFRKAKEAAEKDSEIESMRLQLEAEGLSLPPRKEAGDQFDTNCITPGTPFMARLADALRYYIHDRITNNPAWQKIQVVLSDANVPGEGEHKIMDYIRRQRASPSHNPDTVHCMCGADADLIMLGLATHEANFNILREEFIPDLKRPCELCGQYGHELKDCRGLDAEEYSEYQTSMSPNTEKKMFFIRIPVLREYLERDLLMTGLPFKFEFERIIDDWVFLCFFVGNDFLPHLPCLEIMEQAIDRLIKLYQGMLIKIKGYLTVDGNVNMKGVQYIMTELGKVEEDIFKRRKVEEEEKEARRRRFNHGAHRRESVPWTVQQQDDIRLHEPGCKDRYYRAKFGIDGGDVKFRRQVAWEYARGLCWVLKYYYQGCVSWDWYFPYHYAPFASDFDMVADYRPDFAKNTRPFKPLEQLMAVFPAASKQHLPATWQTLMTSPDSPIIDFYPDTFRIDMNGKKQAWQGVALLPFVDQQRLLRTLQGVYQDLTEDENARDSTGPDRLFIGCNHPAFDSFKALYAEGADAGEMTPINPSLTRGAAGMIRADPTAVMPGTCFLSPIKDHCGYMDLSSNEAIMVIYKDPEFPAGFVFPARRLEKAKTVDRTLKPRDWDTKRKGEFRPKIIVTRTCMQRPPSYHFTRPSFDTASHRTAKYEMRTAIELGRGGNAERSAADYGSYESQMLGYRSSILQGAAGAGHRGQTGGQRAAPATGEWQTVVGRGGYTRNAYVPSDRKVVVLPVKRPKNKGRKALDDLLKGGVAIYSADDEADSKENEATVDGAVEREEVVMEEGKEDNAEEEEYYTGEEDTATGVERAEEEEGETLDAGEAVEKEKEVSLTSGEFGEEIVGEAMLATPGKSGFGSGEMESIETGEELPKVVKRTAKASETKEEKGKKNKRKNKKKKGEVQEMDEDELLDMLVQAKLESSLPQAMEEPKEELAAEKKKPKRKAKGRR